MNIYQSTYRKDLSWLYFDNKSKVPVKPTILKDYFSSATDPSIFTLITPVSLDQLSKKAEFFQHWNQQVTFCLSLPCLRPDSRSETISSCCHRSDAWSISVVSSIISIDSNVTDDIIRKIINDSRKSVGPRIEHWRTPALTGYSCDNFPSRIT